MLVGIAKLAAQSELLESKSQVEYFELPARTILNRTKPGMPFEWAINPYRGCEFGCRYCYARYTHEFMGMEDGRDFEEKIYAKADVAALLRRDLRKVRREDSIAIGTATDPYQPAERRFGRTRAMLEVFAEGKGRRLSITTKSDLIVRDLLLLAEITQGNVLHVNMTITRLDAELARALEPRAPRPDLRLAAVERLAAAGIAVGVFANPILPLITDREESLDRLAAAVVESRRHLFWGRITVPHALRTESLLPVPRTEFPAFVEALPRAGRRECVPAWTLPGDASRPRSQNSREASPRIVPVRLPP